MACAGAGKVQEQVLICGDLCKIYKPIAKVLKAGWGTPSISKSLAEGLDLGPETSKVAQIVCFEK